MKKKDSYLTTKPSDGDPRPDAISSIETGLSELNESAASSLLPAQGVENSPIPFDLRQISHDLNNYLTILMIHCDELKESLSETEQRRTHFELLHDNLRLAASIVHELSFPASAHLASAHLASAHPANAHPDTYMSQGAFHAFLKKQKAVWNLLTGGAMKIELQLVPVEDSGLFIRIIENYAKRACMQIVRNAAEAMFIDTEQDKNSERYSDDMAIPSLFIWVERADNALWLHFQDNGPGVPDTLVNHIFEAGITGHDGQHRGYGLSSAQKLAHLWGGEVRLHRQSAVPEGAHFSLSFPLKP